MHSSCSRHIDVISVLLLILRTKFSMPPNKDDDEERSEARLRQLAEIELLQSAYTPDEAHVTSNTNGCFVVRRALHLSAVWGSVGSSTNESEQYLDATAVKVELSLIMPTAYPVQEDAILTVTGSLISSPTSQAYIRKAALHAVPRLVEACQQSAESQGGGEALWSVLCRADEWVNGLEWENILEEYRQNNAIPTSKSIQREESANYCGKNNSITLGRRIIYSHHIIANSKRRDLANLASQYKLGGYSKIGWPGVILIEGSESNCQSFVNEIKRWRWQQLQVRGEEQNVVLEVDNMDSYRLLPMTFEELGENDMSRLANCCRKAGLEHMFLSCMKIGNDNHRPLIDGDEVPTDRTGGWVEGGGINHGGLNYGVLANVDHMNDGKRYRNWLRKTCRERGCILLIRQFFCSTNNTSRPTIYVGVFGAQSNVRQVMKQWRTSFVDVDSKNKPCLERMMSVVMESSNLQFIPPTNNSLDGERNINCTFPELERIVGEIDQGWLQELQHRHA